MATPSSIIVWRIPWTEEPGRLEINILNSSEFNMFSDRSKYPHTYVNSKMHLYRHMCAHQYT